MHGPGMVRPSRAILARERPEHEQRRHGQAERRDERGAVAVLFGLLALMLFVLAGLVVDLGSARDVRRQAQNAADASALAAANALYPSGSTPSFTAAVSAAQSYASVNFGTPTAAWSTCTDAGRPSGYYVPSGSTPCVSFDSSTAPTRVRVLIPARTLNLGFGSLVNKGSSKLNIQALAEAGATTGSYADCGFCVLGASGTPVQAGGSSVLKVNNTSIHFNGRSDISGNASIQVTNGNFTVSQSPQLSGSASLSPTPTITPVVADPFASLAMPSTSGMVDYGSVNFSGNQSCNLLPGKYGSLTVSGNITCTLAAGIYVFTGSFNPSGNTTIDASSGVTLYFACGSSAAPTTCNNTGGGSFSVSGNTTIKIKAPTSGPTKGLALLYDRGNTNTLQYTGSNADTWYGSIYAASAMFNLSGDASSTNFDTMVVVNGLNLSGNGTMATTYTAANNVPAAAGVPALTK